MKDQDRLGLLKEIAGTIIYEERKIESLKILLETINKQDHIQEILNFIEERLEELEKEKEELIIYDQLDRKRRALHYSLYSIELTKVRSFIHSPSLDRNSRVLDNRTIRIFGNHTT
jgi:structural maintenance of chromosome 3 (chondroitin sulfate proteoglycan 6)